MAMWMNSAYAVAPRAVAPFVLPQFDSGDQRVDSGDPFHYPKP